MYDVQCTMYNGGISLDARDHCTLFIVHCTLKPLFLKKPQRLQVYVDVFWVVVFAADDF